MWVLGDWGQSQPWQRTTGVKMTKDKNDVWTGKLTLPKGTQFEIQVMKSTVSTTSGGINKWSSTRYKSTLNMTASYDFGEFNTNLVPNGDFEGTEAQWTPAESIVARDNAHGGGKILSIADVEWSGGLVASSDVFVIPPSQSLRFSFYVRVTKPIGEPADVSVKDVDTQSILFKETLKPTEDGKWIAVSGAFKSDGTPVRAQIICQTYGNGIFAFDDMSLVSV